MVLPHQALVSPVFHGACRYYPQVHLSLDHFSTKCLATTVATETIDKIRLWKIKSYGVVVKTEFYATAFRGGGGGVGYLKNFSKHNTMTSEVPKKPL